MLVVTVFTDGSADNITKKKGGAGVYFEDKKYHNLNRSDKYTGHVTNQRMELQACINAIETARDMLIEEKKEWSVKIYSDSMYSINCATVWARKWVLNGWKRKNKKKYVDIENKELIIKLYILTCMYPIEYVHVRSHQKEPKKGTEEHRLWYGNNMADQLARDAYI